MTRKTRPPEAAPVNSSSSVTAVEGVGGRTMANSFPSAVQNNLRDMGGKRVGMQAEPPNELAPHIQRASSSLSQNAALQQQQQQQAQAPLQEYTSADFKLLEERISRKMAAMQQQFHQSLRESEDRIMRKIVDCAEWSSNQTKEQLQVQRESIVSALLGEDENGFEVTQPLEDDHGGMYGQQGKAPRRPPQRTPMRRTATPLWSGTMPRSDTFGSQTRDGYVPNAVSRTMSMPQTFMPTASPFQSFNRMDSMMGTPLGQAASQPLPVSVKRRLKNESSVLSTQQSPSQNSQNLAIPKYKLSRAIKTVAELWQEWTVGFQGGPSVKELEELYKSSWRNGMAERQFFSRRKVVIDEVIRRGDELYQDAVKKREARKQFLLGAAAHDPASNHELQTMQDNSDLWNECHKKAAEDLDRERGRISLNALSGKLRKQKNAERGGGGSFSQDADGHMDDEDAEGDENDEEPSQMTDTQYTESQAQGANSQHHDDLMEIEHPGHEDSQQHSQRDQRRNPQQQNSQQQRPTKPQTAPTAPMLSNSTADDQLNMARDVIHGHQVRPGSNSTGSSEEEARSQLQGVATSNTGTDGDGLDDHFHTFEGFVEVDGIEKVGEMDEHVGKKRRVE